MRRFRAIIQTKMEPEDKEVLWFYKGVLRYYENNWIPLLKIPDSSQVTCNVPQLGGYVSLQKAIQYILDSINHYIVVDTIQERNSIVPLVLKDGLHVYVISTNITYIYNSKFKLWIEKQPKVNSQSFTIYADKAIVLKSDIKSRTITIDNQQVFNVSQDEKRLISYSIKDDRLLSSYIGNILTYNEVQEDIEYGTFTIQEGIMPKVGTYIYNLGIINDTNPATKTLVLSTNSEDSAGIPSLRLYTNSKESCWEVYDVNIGGSQATQISGNLTGEVTSTILQDDGTTRIIRFPQSVIINELLINDIRSQLDSIKNAIFNNGTDRE